MSQNPEWERIADGTYRLAVYDGWIVNCVNETLERETSVFVPDKWHYWKLNKEEVTQ